MYTLLNSAKPFCFYNCPQFYHFFPQIVFINIHALKNYLFLILLQLILSNSGNEIGNKKCLKQSQSSCQRWNIEDQKFNFSPFADFVVMADAVNRLNFPSFFNSLILELPAAAFKLRYNNKSPKS